LALRGITLSVPETNYSVLALLTERGLRKVLLEKAKCITGGITEVKDFSNGLGGRWVGCEG
jgi:hypothetical protein